MEIRYKLYPYPVLAYYSDDYKDGSFDTTIDLQKDGYNIRIDFMASLTNEGLKKLIHDGQARPCMKVAGPLGPIAGAAQERPDDGPVSYTHLRAALHAGPVLRPSDLLRGLRGRHALYAAMQIGRAHV